MSNLFTQAFEVIGIHRGCRRRRSALQQKRSQMLTILIPSDQVTHVLTTGAVATRRHLLINEFAHRIWKRDIHRAHIGNLVGLANFGKSGYEAV